MFFFPVFRLLVTLRATCRLRRTTTQYWCGVLHDIMHKRTNDRGCDRPPRCVRVPRAQPPLRLTISAPQRPPVRSHCSSHARPTSGPLWARYGSQAVAFVVPPPASGSGTGWETKENSGGQQLSWGAGGARGGVGALRSLEGSTCDAPGCIARDIPAGCGR